MKATVNKSTCIGCELCPSVCPEVFAMGDDGLAYTIVDEIPTDAQATAQESADSCPVDAIAIQ
ncbi:ferredoxin [Chitinispirillales bacterium ANBcel5]|uniref:ferredoxin n=1 Tax=Cellulosispirillum alkaliphilum TaxID=3039283 RepID=UPI002A58253D|nr:ferredoxin [Chitinispirillales bacterium ANBcel5]